MVSETSQLYISSFKKYIKTLIIFVSLKLDPLKTTLATISYINKFFDYILEF